MPVLPISDRQIVSQSLQHPSETNGGWLGWAVFLGVSWTWCIGMFLPVLLVRDYGVWAWVVFAIPNVVGAAAMGWTIDAEKSRRMVRAHRAAMIAFSVVTVAFQLFFIMWTLAAPKAMQLRYMIGVFAVAVASLFIKSSRRTSVIVLIASILCAVGMFSRGEASVNGIASGLSTPPTVAIAWLSPVCIFGFLLCPYLDSTFHTARQHLSNRNSKLAFGIGFGLVFFAAIILSLLYAGPVHLAMDLPQGSTPILRWIKIYWMIQLGFTIGVHRSLEHSADRLTRTRIDDRLLLPYILIFVVEASIWILLGVSGENVYRGFLGFYGLVFPAYVWLAVLPGRGVVPPTRRVLIVLGIAIAIALPMFFMAFIERQLIWGVPGVGVVLLSRLFISRPTIGHESQPDTEFLAQQNSAPTS